MEGVLAPERGELETVRLFGGEAQLVGCQQRQKVLRWCVTQASGHYAQGIVSGLVDKASMSIATPYSVVE